MGEGESYWVGGGVSGGVQEQPEPESGGEVGPYEGGPLSSTVDSQEMASRAQQAKWPTLLVARLTYFEKLHALSVSGSLVGPTAPVSTILIGDSAASTHGTGDYAISYNKRPPIPDDIFFIIGDGNIMEVEFLDCVGVVLHCVEALKNVGFVLGVSFDFCLFNVIHKEHVITLDHEEAHMANGGVLFRKKKFGNYVEVTRVARDGTLAALAVAA